MSCEARYDDILLLAADGLDRDEREQLTAHLASGCPRCAGAWAEAQALVSHLAFAVEPIDPPPALRARILDQVARAPRGSAVPEASTELPDRSNVTRLPVRRRWLAPAAAAGLAASLTAVVLLSVHSDERDQLLGRITQQEQRIGRQESQIRELEASSAAGERVRRLLASNRLDYVPLGGTAVQPSAAARVLWDRDANRWHLVVAAMQPLPTGRTYELWFITSDQRKVAAGTFDIGVDGTAELTVEIPPGIGEITLAAITDEPTGGSEQPTGQIQAVGTIS